MITDFVLTLIDAWWKNISQYVKYKLGRSFYSTLTNVLFLVLSINAIFYLLPFVTSIPFWNIVGHLNRFRRYHAQFYRRIISVQPGKKIAALAACNISVSPIVVKFITGLINKLKTKVNTAYTLLK